MITIPLILYMLMPGPDLPACRDVAQAILSDGRVALVYRAPVPAPRPDGVIDAVQDNAGRWFRLAGGIVQTECIG